LQPVNAVVISFDETDRLHTERHSIPANAGADSTNTEVWLSKTPTALTNEHTSVPSLLRLSSQFQRQTFIADRLSSDRTRRSVHPQRHSHQPL